MDELSIRAAKPEDVETVHDFILALADYEQLQDEVIATVEDTHTALFGSAPVAEVLLAEINGEPAGFALFYRSYSTFVGKPGLYLEDLFVLPEHRGIGLGKELLIYLAKLVRERDWGRMEWAVLNWNSPSIAFYEGLGADRLEEWSTYRLHGEALRNLAAGRTFLS